MTKQCQSEFANSADTTGTILLAKVRGKAVANQSQQVNIPSAKQERRPILEHNQKIQNTIQIDEETPDVDLAYPKAVE